MKQNILLLTFLLSFVSIQTMAQDWNIEDAEATSPIEFNAKSIEAGKELYITNCKSCHGDPGMNNPLSSLNPAPVDIVSDQIQENSDAELYYKVLNGKGLMPQFKAILGEEGVWQVVSFIRSFNVNYTPTERGAEEQVVEAQKAKLELNINQEEELIYASATAIAEDGSLTPLAKTQITFTIKRTFGNMEFAKAKTDSIGVVTIEFPKDLPGNEEGAVDMVASLSGPYEGITAEIENAKICKAHAPINIFEKRALWRDNKGTSWWVILSYLGVVGAVWITIFYVVFQIIQVKKLSKEE